MYMVNDQGIVTCLNVLSGKPMWVERMAGPHTASLLYSAGRIYAFGEDGRMRVFTASPAEFVLLAENRLNEGCMASPAVVEDAFVVRTRTHLYRIERATH